MHNYIKVILFQISEYGRIFMLEVSATILPLLTLISNNNNNKLHY